MKNNLKLICFDLNKTLIHENTWYDLNLAMGVTAEEDALLVQLFEEGVITYHTWLTILQNIYKKRGNPTQDSIEKLVSNYTLIDGSREAVNYCKDQGYEVALITGAMDILVEIVAKDLGITWYDANHSFLFDENGLLEKITIFDHDDIAKLHQLRRICRRLGLKETDCACVGDGDNDFELFQKTKHGITFPGSKIENIAWKTISSLSELQNII